MTTHLSVNNYYGINDCNTIYMGFWKNENIVFFLTYLYYLFSLFFYLSRDSNIWWSDFSTDVKNFIFKDYCRSSFNWIFLVVVFFKKTNVNVLILSYWLFLFILVRSEV